MAQNGRFESSISVAKIGPTNYSKIMGRTRAYKRSSISIKEGPRSLLITIKAQDPSALRASMNVMMRQIQIIESVTGKDFRKPVARDKAKNL